jgi:predicted glycosyltransferase
MKKIWIDILNPSHPLFFKPLTEALKDEYDFCVTVRDRGETIKLTNDFGLTAQVIGKDYEENIKKMLSIIRRTLLLSYKVKSFDYAISFENPMSVAVSKMKRKRSILLLDNDLKYSVKSNIFQDLESKIKLMADTIIIPRACETTFCTYGMNNRLKYYDGFKEDFYIADYLPDQTIIKKLPFKDYVIIRGEALYSFYVNKKQSIVPKLFELFTKENINILFLPRDKSDFIYKENNNLSILKEPINGLDLVYYSDAVLTGSGTMAREAACLGRTAVSFFPRETLLSVDRQLIDEGKIFHSRDAREIVDYVVSHMKKNSELNVERSKLVKNKILKMINNAIIEN